MISLARRHRSDAALRRGALGLFVVTVAMSIGAVALNPGLKGRPGLAPDYSPLDLGLVTVGVAVAVIGLLLAWARPRNSVGWLLALAMFLLAACNFGETYGVRAVVVPGEGLAPGTFAIALCAPLWLPALLIPGTVLLARYPSGHLTGRWARRFDRAFVAGMVGVLIVYMTSQQVIADDLVGHANPLHIPQRAVIVVGVPSAVLVVIGAVGVVASAVVRMFRASYPERQQLAWLFTAALLAVVLVLFTPYRWLGDLTEIGVALAVAVGVLRYRLLGIQVVLRRTLVYGTLTGLVLGVFVAVTAGLTEVVPHAALPRLVAAVLIAVGVVPTRDRLQRAVDRFVYGERRDPWRAVARLSTPMGSVADEVVLAVLSGVAGALRVPGAAVLDSGGRGEGAVLASYGECEAVAARVPLSFAGLDLGVLAIAARPGETAPTRTDLRMLGTLAPLVAAAVHAERLTADLRAARSRLVTATAAERGRLRQELHDGLGPSLTGVGLGLEALGRRVDGDAGAGEMIARLRAEVGAALEETRRIIDDLRPAIFDEVDLLTALRRRCQQLTADGALTVELVAPHTLPPLAPEYETAVWRIADEALTNVVRHASARRCDVFLRVDDGLRLVVADDGVGVDGGTSGRSGVGLTSMRQRAERLGGNLTIAPRSPGTAVVVDLPVAVAT